MDRLRELNADWRSTNSALSGLTCVSAELNNVKEPEFSMKNSSLGYLSIYKKTPSDKNAKENENLSNILNRDSQQKLMSSRSKCVPFPFKVESVPASNFKLAGQLMMESKIAPLSSKRYCNKPGNPRERVSKNIRFHSILPRLTPPPLSPVTVPSVTRMPLKPSESNSKNVFKMSAVSVPSYDSDNGDVQIIETPSSIPPLSRRILQGSCVLEPKVDLSLPREPLQYKSSNGKCDPSSSNTSECNVAIDRKSRSGRRKQLIPKDAGTSSEMESGNVQSCLFQEAPREIHEVSKECIVRLDDSPSPDKKQKISPNTSESSSTSCLPNPRKSEMTLGLPPKSRQINKINTIVLSDSSDDEQPIEAKSFSVAKKCDPRKAAAKKPKKQAASKSVTPKSNSRDGSKGCANPSKITGVESRTPKRKNSVPSTGSKRDHSEVTELSLDSEDDSPKYVSRTGRSITLTGCKSCPGCKIDRPRKAKAKLDSSKKIVKSSKDHEEQFRIATRVPSPPNPVIMYCWISDDSGDEEQLGIRKAIVERHSGKDAGVVKETRNGGNTVKTHSRVDIERPDVIHEDTSRLCGAPSALEGSSATKRVCLTEKSPIFAEKSTLPVEYETAFSPMAKVVKPLNSTTSSNLSHSTSKDHEKPQDGSAPLLTVDSSETADKVGTLVTLDSKYAECETICTHEERTKSSPYTSFSCPVSKDKINSNSKCLAPRKQCHTSNGVALQGHPNGNPSFKIDENRGSRASSEEDLVQERRPVQNESEICSKIQEVQESPITSDISGDSASAVHHSEKSYIRNNGQCGSQKDALMANLSSTLKCKPGLLDANPVGPKAIIEADRRNGMACQVDCSRGSCVTSISDSRVPRSTSNSLKDVPKSGSEVYHADEVAKADSVDSNHKLLEILLLEGCPSCQDPDNNPDSQDSAKRCLPSPEISPGKDSRTEEGTFYQAVSNLLVDCLTTVDCVKLDHREVIIKKVKPGSSNAEPAAQECLKADDSASVLQDLNLSVSLNPRLTIRKLPCTARNEEKFPAQDFTSLPSLDDHQVPENKCHLPSIYERKGFPTPIKKLNPRVLSVLKYDELEIDNDEPSLNDPPQSDRVEFVSSKGIRLVLQPEDLAQIDHFLNTKISEARVIGQHKVKSFEFEELVIYNDEPQLNSTPKKSLKASFPENEDLDDLLIDDADSPLNKVYDPAAHNFSGSDCMVISSDDEVKIQPEFSRIAVDLCDGPRKKLRKKQKCVEAPSEIDAEKNQLPGDEDCDQILDLSELESVNEVVIDGTDVEPCPYWEPLPASRSCRQLLRHPPVFNRQDFNPSGHPDNKNLSLARDSRPDAFDLSETLLGSQVSGLTLSDDTWSASEVDEVIEISPPKLSKFSRVNRFIKRNCDTTNVQKLDTDSDDEVIVLSGPDPPVNSKSQSPKITPCQPRNSDPPNSFNRNHPEPASVSSFRTASRRPYVVFVVPPKGRQATKISRK